MKKTALIVILLIAATACFSLITEVEPNNSFAEAQVLDCGETGEIITGQRLSYNDDYFTFPVHDGDTVIFGLDYGMDKLDVNIYNQNEELVGTFGVTSANDEFYYVVDNSSYGTDTAMEYMVVTAPVSSDWASYNISVYSTYETLPVTLTSFSATQTSENFAELAWSTESESDMSGYRLLRADNDDLSATVVASTFIPATNDPQGCDYSYCDIEVEMDNTYFYWLESQALNGETKQHGPVSVTLSPLGGEGGETPEVFATELAGCYPNPFNPMTTVLFSLETESQVDIAVYNLRGQLVRQLESGVCEAGDHRVVWDGTTDNEQSAGSGIYFVRMSTPSYSFIKKAMLLK